MGILGAEITITDCNGNTATDSDGLTMEEICCANLLEATSANTALLQEIIDCLKPQEEKRNAILTRLTETGPGTTPANAISVSIVNVGKKDGVVLGQPLKPSENTVYHAPQDPSDSRCLMLLSSIAFDATGTEFRIQIIT